MMLEWNSMRGNKTHTHTQTTHTNTFFSFFLCGSPHFDWHKEFIKCLINSLTENDPLNVSISEFHLSAIHLAQTVSLASRLRNWGEKNALTREKSMHAPRFSRLIGRNKFHVFSLENVLLVAIEERNSHTYTHHSYMSFWSKWNYFNSPDKHHPLLKCAWFFTIVTKKNT